MKKVLYHLLIFPVILFAQINESDTLNFKANLSLTGFWQGGNVDALIYRAKSGLTFKASSDWVFKTQNSYVYQEFGKAKADEDILSLNFIYFHPEKRIYPLVLGFVSTNFRRQIDLRFLFGGGVTYQVIKDENDWLKLSITSEFERTEFANAKFNFTEYNEDKSIRTLRGTIWVNGKYHLFEKKVILNHEIYFQPSIGQGNNYRWQADIGLELPIWKFFNFKINYLHTFESIVIEDQKQEDSILTLGFTIKSY